MKIQKFLECVEKKLLNYPNIDFPTLKLFIDKFVKCMSKIEFERNSLLIAMINNATTSQITIEEFERRENNKKLNAELIKMKKEFI